VLEGAARDPEEWREPFAWTANDAGVMHDLGNEHFVRAQQNADFAHEAAFEETVR
jgi:hypothetical protein